MKILVKSDFFFKSARKSADVSSKLRLGKKDCNEVLALKRLVKIFMKTLIGNYDSAYHDVTVTLKRLIFYLN